MTQVHAKTCMYYKAQEFHFWEQYRLSTWVTVSTLSNIFVKMLALISLLDKGNDF